MFGKRPTTLIAGALLAGLTGPALASEADALRSEVDTLRAEVAALRQNSDENWLNERRASEIKGLIRDVLSDAETRSTLLQEGMMAGNDNGKFFLKSADGNFLMNISAFAQIRYVANFQNSRANGTGGDDQNQFQLNRAKIRLDGHIIDPSWGYFFQLATNIPEFDTSTNQGPDGTLRQNGFVYMQEAGMSKQVTDDIKLYAGVMKTPFLREFLLYETDLLAVDRASATEFFNIGRTAQFLLEYTGFENFKIFTSINNGSRVNLNPFNDDGGLQLYGNNTINSNNYGFAVFGSNAVEFGVTGRADWKVWGDWDQQDDFVAWRGDDSAFFVGAAVNYEIAKLGVTRNLGGGADYFSYTADALWKQNGLSIMGAFMGSKYINPTEQFTDRDSYGAIAYLAYMLTDEFQPFVRGEWFTDGTAGAEDIIGATFGFNYYFARQNAKLSMDVVWFFQGDIPQAQSYAFARNPFGPALGLNNGPGQRISDNNIVAIRGQFQIAF
ncbi:hypothetical protein JD969_13130 [Planctomycetota bacterium]|nr:hypothetical protein JD969_13130 [Planctomycetota bacterium]